MAWLLKFFHYFWLYHSFSSLSCYHNVGLFYSSYKAVWWILELIVIAYKKMSFIYYLSFKFYCKVFTVENKICFDGDYLFDYWLVSLLYYHNEWMKLFIHLLGICICYFSLSLKLFFYLLKFAREHWILHHTS